MNTTDKGPVIGINIVDTSNNTRKKRKIKTKIQNTIMKLQIEDIYRKYWYASGVGSGGGGGGGVN